MYYIIIRFIGIHCAVFIYSSYMLFDVANDVYYSAGLIAATNVMINFQKFIFSFENASKSQPNCVYIHISLASLIK